MPRCYREPDRGAGFEFAKSKWVIGVFCVTAVALMLYDLPNFRTQELYPACQYDLIRYSSAASETTRCWPDQPPAAAQPEVAAGGWRVSAALRCAGVRAASSAAMTTPEVSSVISSA